MFNYCSKSIENVEYFLSSFESFDWIILVFKVLLCEWKYLSNSLNKLLQRYEKLQSVHLEIWSIKLWYLSFPIGNPFDKYKSLYVHIYTNTKSSVQRIIHVFSTFDLKTLMRVKALFKMIYIKIKWNERIKTKEN